MHFQGILLLLALGFLWSVDSEEFKIKNKHHSRRGRLYRKRRSLFAPIIVDELMRQKFIDGHNSYRREVEPKASNIREIEWDEELQDLATNYSRQCKYPKHRPEEERTTSLFTVVGENMAQWGTLSAESVMHEWFIEKEDYTYKNDACKYGKECGHYKQLVWWKSHMIGCGVSICNGLLNGKRGYLFVCNYGPAGNIKYYNQNSQPVLPYTAGEPASACDSEFPHNNNGLCSKLAEPTTLTTTTTLSTTTATVENHANENGVNSIENFEQKNPTDEDGEDTSNVDGGQGIASTSRKAILLCLVGFAMHFFCLFV